MQAARRAESGEVTLSFDQKSGIQALERIAGDRPMFSGQPRLLEYEYRRHGTTCLMAALDVVTGQVSGYMSEGSSEEHCCRVLEKILAENARATKIRIVCDNLRPHQSEGFVRIVARECGLDAQALGRKRREGILRSLESRKQFLEDESHRVVFCYTPRHASWMNQIEMWFSVLVRRLLRRASFRSLEELKGQVLGFIDFFNRTWAKPYKWTYGGRPLVS